MENLLALMVSLEPLKHGCVLNLRGAACQGQCQGYTAPMHSAKLLVERHPKPQAASRVATMLGTQVDGDKKEPKLGCRRCGVLETAIIIRTEPLCRYVVALEHGRYACRNLTLVPETVLSNMYTRK